MANIITTLHAFDSDLGVMAIAWEGSLIFGLTFGHRSKVSALAYFGEGSHSEDVLSSEQKKIVERLQRFAAGEYDNFADLSLDLSDQSPFSRRVIKACRALPFGATASYAELATLAGSPRAARAVGNVMAKNRFPLIIPCHRIIAASGKLGGYSAPEGLSMKRLLLAREKTLCEQDAACTH